MEKADGVREVVVGGGGGAWDSHTAGRLAAVCKLFGGQFSPASSAPATAFLRHYLKMHTRVFKTLIPPPNAHQQETVETRGALEAWEAWRAALK